MLYCIYHMWNTDLMSKRVIRGRDLMCKTSFREVYGLRNMSTGEVDALIEREVYSMYIVMEVYSMGMCTIVEV